MNKELLQLKNADFFTKQISDAKAVEKGVEVYYEIIFYSILIGLPLYEMYRGIIETKEKKQRVADSLNHIT